MRKYIKRLTETWGKSGWSILNAFALVLAVSSAVAQIAESGLVQELLRLVFSIAFPFANATQGTVAANGENGLSIVSGVVTLSFLIALFWTLWVTMHSDNEKAREHAKGFAQMLMGVLVGSARAAFGL